MNFLLVAVNAKYIHSNPAVYSLQLYAERVYPGAVSILETTINTPFHRILSDICECRPDVIGFSCYIWNIDIVKKLLSDLPKVLPDTDVWLGGPEVSFEYESYFRDYSCVRGIIVGEGESAFTRVVGEYVLQQAWSEAEAEVGTDDGATRNIPGVISGMADSRALDGRNYEAADFTGIPNIALRERPTVISSDLSDMDSMPFIYEDGMSSFDHRIVYYESSRGCPYRCSYCLSSVDKTVRYRSLPFVFRELQFFLDSEVPLVKFIDRTFNSDKERSKAIWNYIREHDNGKTQFHFEITAEFLDKEEIDLLRQMRPGQVQLEIGIQTTNLDTLLAVNRPAKVHKIAKAIEELRKNGNLHLHLDLIAGLPYEGFRSFRNSFNDVYGMAPTNIQLGFLKVLKGAPIEKDCERFGILYSEEAPYEVLSTRWLKFDEICELKHIEEMVELYYNSAQFTVTLPLLLPAFETPFDFFSALADFYKEKGYFTMTPARSRRYEILLEFAEERTTLYEDDIRDALTLDYYLRENPKSRPDFVRSVPPAGRIDTSVRDPITGNFHLVDLPQEEDNKA
ncbi:MAG: B12-binding domain-containing radical SAM protein [Clostridiales bacterium]|nr:B12-binding domain-containing radical SAM protein [Clostridiales bacterium]